MVADGASFDSSAIAEVMFCTSSDYAYDHQSQALGSADADNSFAVVIMHAINNLR